jgi:hypothetical protein
MKRNDEKQWTLSPRDRRVARESGRRDPEAGSWRDPFAIFYEWSGAADEKAYSSL